jgi:hypothetical protein
LDERLLVTEASLYQAVNHFRRDYGASSSNVMILDLTKIFGEEAVAQQIMDQVDSLYLYDSKRWNEDGLEDGYSQYQRDSKIKYKSSLMTQKRLLLNRLIIT